MENILDRNKMEINMVKGYCVTEMVVYSLDYGLMIKNLKEYAFFRTDKVIKDISKDQKME